MKKNATRLRITFRLCDSASVNESESFEDGISDVCIEIDVDSKGSDPIELLPFLSCFIFDLSKEQRKLKLTDKQLF